jgi:hypothetical protein
MPDGERLTEEKFAMLDPKPETNPYFTQEEGYDIIPATSG